MVGVANLTGLNPGPETGRTDNQVPVIYDADTQSLLVGGAPITVGSAQLPSNIMGQAQRAQASTVVTLGDSVMAYMVERIAVSAASVVGNGSITTVNSNFQPVLDGTPLNLACPGAPFDQQQIAATSINNTTFSFPSKLVGVAPAGLETSNQWLLSDRGFITWANRFMGQRMIIVNDACFGGNTTAQMLARIPTQVLPFKPSYCIVMGGVNDLGQTPAFIINNLAQIYQLLLANNITPIALTILPLNSSYGGGGSSFTVPTGVMLAANQLIRNYCAANNIICIDTYQSMVDTSATNGQGVSTYYATGVSDFVHPVCQASRLVGQQIANVLNPLFAPVSLYGNNAADAFGTYSSNLNLLDQSPYASSGGTISNTGGGTAPTGTMPTNFTVNHVNNTTGTCTASVPARTALADGDTVGNNVQLVITAGSGSADQWTLAVSPDITSRLVPGGTYQFRCKLRFSGITGSKLYNVVNQWLINDASVVRTGYVGGGFQDQAIQNDSQWADGTYDYASGVFKCPSWASNGCQVIFYFSFFAAVGTAVTINVGRCTFMRLS